MTESTFPSNGMRLGMEVRQGNSEFVVLNGRKLDSFKGVALYMFCSDEKKLGYLALTDNELWWKVFDLGG